MMNIKVFDQTRFNMNSETVAEEYNTIYPLKGSKVNKVKYK